MPEVTTRVRVSFVDVDSSQRIHFAAMFRYMEVAEHELMRALGFPYATALRQLAFPRVHLECDFRGAIFYDDVLDIVARIERVGSSSWTVHFTAHPAALEGIDSEPAEDARATILAEGRMTIVAMNPETERATALPDNLRRALLEG
jgi:acyl-CoA thioester hydrolase